MSWRTTSLTSTLWTIVAITGVSGIATNGYAQNDSYTVEINQYVHNGCSTNPLTYLPSYAHLGGIATFRLPGDKQNYLDTTNRSKVTCEWATDYQSTNPDWELWKDGVKGPCCLNTFSDEEPNSVRHYEAQIHKYGVNDSVSLEPFGLNWIITENQPCQVYSPDADPDGSVTWTGDCVDGKASGEGRLVWRGDYDGTAVYEGRLREGRVHGYGSITFPSGNRYEGEWHHSKRHGYGTIIWANGTRYEGEWRDDKKHGFGNQTWYFGDHYEGEWHDDKKHGFGIYTWAEGDRYEGEWREGKAHGYGTNNWANGNRYEGEWRENRMHGYGTYTWADGSRYEGDFSYDRKHGYGTITSPDGRRYEGEWYVDRPIIN